MKSLRALVLLTSLAAAIAGCSSSYDPNALGSNATWSGSTNPIFNPNTFGNAGAATCSLSQVQGTITPQNATGSNGTVNIPLNTSATFSISVSAPGCTALEAVLPNNGGTIPLTGGTGTFTTQFSTPQTGATITVNLLDTVSGAQGTLTSQPFNVGGSSSSGTLACRIHAVNPYVPVNVNQNYVPQQAPPQFTFIIETAYASGTPRLLQLVDSNHVLQMNGYNGQGWVATVPYLGMDLIAAYVGDSSGNQTYCVTVVDVEPIVMAPAPVPPPAANPAQAYVQHVYQVLLGRSADPAGLSYWASQLQSGTRQQEVVAGIIDSNEFYQDIGNSPTAYVNALYQHLLNRTADAGGVAYWVNLLNSGASRYWVAEGFVNSAEYQNLIQSNGGTAPVY